MSKFISGVILFLVVGFVSFPFCSAEEEELPEDFDNGNGQSVTLKERLPELNRYTFHNSVLRDFGDYDIKEWIVLFCPRWFGPCQAMLPKFAQVGHQWEEHLNTGLLSSSVRFAFVDCATEKALCNEQGVEDYPWVNHYHEHTLSSGFTSHNEKKVLQQFTSWLDNQLKDHYDIEAAADLSDLPAERSSKTTGDADQKSGYSDYMLIVAIIMGNAFLIMRNFDGSSSSASSPKQASSTIPVLSSAAASAPQSAAYTPAHHDCRQENQAGTAPVARSLHSMWAEQHCTIEL